MSTDDDAKPWLFPDPAIVWAIIGTVIIGAALLWALFRAIGISRHPNMHAHVGCMFSEGFAPAPATPTPTLGPSSNPIVTPSAPPRGIKLVDKVRSRFYDVEVIDTMRPDLGRCLLLDSEIRFCAADAARYNEMITHFGVQYLQPAACPSRVLIVGGGDGRILREVLKYAAMQEVLVLELDDMVTRIAEKYFGASRAASDERVRWVFGPLEASIENLPRDKFDLIIVNTPETTKADSSVTDKKAFYDQLRRAMLPAALGPSVLVKNGERGRDALKRAFGYTLEYGYDSKTHERRYTFTLAADFDLRQQIITTGAWSTNNIETSFYSLDRHFEFVKWTEEGFATTNNTSTTATATTIDMEIDNSDDDKENDVNQNTHNEKAKKSNNKNVLKSAAEQQQRPPRKVEDRVLLVASSGFLDIS